MTKKKPVIALAQIRYFDVSTKHNKKKIKQYIKLAKKVGADIVCFPESCLYKSSLELEHKIIKEIQEECRKNQIWCIVTDDIVVKGRTYNISILINRKGEIKGGYKKIHLYGDRKVTPGKKAMVFRTDFGKIGIAICWDLAFPDLFREMKAKGAQIVFCPSQWWYDTKAHDKKHAEREMEILESLVLARAYENVFFVALCNPVVDSKFQISYSVIASPTKILNKIVKKEGLIVSEVNLSEIKRMEKIYSS
jgi:predicted amidohydrolase